MKKYQNVMAVAGVAVAYLFALWGLVGLSQIDPTASAQVAKTPVKTSEEYRKKVLDRIDRGDRVRVPDERIGDLSGAVKLVDKTKMTTKSTAKSVDLGMRRNLEAEIASVADQIADRSMRSALSDFAKNGSDEARSDFVNGGKFYVDQLNAKASPAPTEDTTKKCYDSCETISRILCKEVCTWDCRIVNGEKVCEKSCETICPEITNIVCKKVCD